MPTRSALLLRGVLAAVPAADAAEAADGSMTGLDGRRRCLGTPARAEDEEEVTKVGELAFAELAGSPAFFAGFRGRSCFFSGTNFNSRRRLERRPPPSPSSAGGTDKGACCWRSAFFFAPMPLRRSFSRAACSARNSFSSSSFAFTAPPERRAPGSGEAASEDETTLESEPRSGEPPADEGRREDGIGEKEGEARGTAEREWVTPEAPCPASAALCCSLCLRRSCLCRRRSESGSWRRLSSIWMLSASASACTSFGVTRVFAGLAPALRGEASGERVGVLELPDESGRRRSVPPSPAPPVAPLGQSGEAAGVAVGRAVLTLRSG